MAFGSLQGIVGRAGGNEVIGRGIIDIGVSSYRVRHDMRTISAAINKETKLWGQAFRLAGVAMGAMVVAGTATIVGAISQAEKFNSAMAKVAAMTGVTTSEIQKLRQGILDMAGTVKQGPEELAKALYFIASAGFRGVSALKLLDQAAKASAASGADLEVAADALVSIMNAYGLSADKASYASNILTKTVMYGKVEFQDLAKAIGPVSTISRVAGVSLEEMGAALAMLTTRGLSARRATNTLWSTLRALTKPTEQQWKMLKAIGLDKFKPEDIKKNGLIATLRTVDNAVQKWVHKTKKEKVKLTYVYDPNGKLNIEKSNKAFEKMNRGYFDVMSKVMGQSNAFLVSQILLQKGVTENFDFYLDRMKSFGVSTDMAYRQAKKLDMSIVFGEMTSSIQKALIELGDKFLPTIAQVVKWIGQEGPKAVKWFSGVLFNTLIPAAQQAAGTIGKLIGTITQIFTFSTGGGGKSPLETTLDVVINLFSYLFTRVDQISGALNALFSNSLAKQIGGIVAAALSLAAVLSLIRTLSIGAFGKVSGLTRALSFGKVGVSSSSSATAVAAKASSGLASAGAYLRVAADSLITAGEIGARSLMVAGFALEEAAMALKIAASMNGGMPISKMFPGWFMNNGGNLQRNAGGVFGHALPPGAIPSASSPFGYKQPINMIGGPMGPASPLPGVAGAAGAAGTQIIATSGNALVGGMKRGLGGIKSFLGFGMGLVSKAFLPLMVTDLVGNLLKEPLGDILGSNPLTGTYFKDAGAAMKEDFWGGLMTAAETILSGGHPDMYKGLADKTQMGKVTIDTMTLKNLGISAATVKSLQSSETTNPDGSLMDAVQQLESKKQHLRDVASIVKEYQAQLGGILTNVSSMTLSGDVGDPALAAAMAILDAARKQGIDASTATTYGTRSGESVYAGLSQSERDKFLASGAQLSTLQRQTITIDPEKLKELAIKLGGGFAATAQQMRSDFKGFLIDAIAQQGDVKFSAQDLRKIDAGTLESIFNATTKDVNGDWANIRTWYINSLINAANSAAATKLNMKLPGNHDLALKQFKENLGSLDMGNQIAGLTEDLAKLKEQLGPEQWDINTKALERFGNAIEKNSGHVLKYGDVVNEMFAPELAKYGKGKKGQTGFWRLQTAGKGTKTTKDDVWQYMMGAKKVSYDAWIAEINDYWNRATSFVGSLGESVGLDKIAGIRDQVNSVVQQGLRAGMSLFEMQTQLGPELWAIFARNIQGEKGGADLLAEGMSATISDAWNKAKKSGGKVDKGEATSLANMVNNMFGLTGKKKYDWKTVKALFKDPKALRDFIAGKVKTAVAGGVEDGITGGVVGTTGTATGPGANNPYQNVHVNPKIPTVGITSDQRESFIASGDSIAMYVAEGLGSDNAVTSLQVAAENTITSGVDWYLMHSPAKKGPLSGTKVHDAGAMIMTTLAGGMVTGGSKLRVAMNAALTAGLGEGSLAWNNARTAGLNIGAQIADGLAAGMAGVGWVQELARALGSLLPIGSPARRGPFSSWAWKMPYTAGVNLAGQMTAGLNKNDLSLPGLQAGVRNGMRLAGNPLGAHQTINVDRLELQSQADEASILARLQFLQPMGR